MKSSAILIVDDEPDILKVTKEGLETAGFNAYAFANPKAALDHLAQNVGQYNLLISDIKMPQMNGFELARSVVKLDPKIKVILMTAFEANLSDFAKLMPSTRIDGVLRKPFKTSRLLQVVDKTLIEPISIS